MTPDPELPVHVEDQVRAELRDLGARDRAAAPSPDEVIERMAANGLPDPEPDFPPDEVRDDEFVDADVILADLERRRQRGEA